MAITAFVFLQDDYGTQIGARFFLLTAPATKVGADRFLDQSAGDSVRVYSGSLTLAIGVYRVELFDVSAPSTIDTVAWIGEAYANVIADGVTVQLESTFAVLDSDEYRRLVTEDIGIVRYVLSPP